MYLYEKAVSSVPCSIKIWRLYFEFLDSLGLSQKTVMIDTINNNRKILIRVFPQSLSFTIPLLYVPALKGDLEDLFAAVIDDLLESKKTFPPNYFWFFATILYVFDKANSQSKFLTFSQRANLDRKSLQDENIETEAEGEIFIF